MISGLSFLNLSLRISSLSDEYDISLCSWCRFAFTSCIYRFCSVWRPANRLVEGILFSSPPRLGVGYIRWTYRSNMSLNKPGEYASHQGRDCWLQWELCGALSPWRHISRRPHKGNTVFPWRSRCRHQFFHLPLAFLLFASKEYKRYRLRSKRLGIGQNVDDEAATAFLMSADLKSNKTPHLHLSGNVKWPSLVVIEVID